ncbi:hypothetical protein C8Q75DRAFT_803065 [Abortiporus biennis]|nr:hypothetical protein C8Q75DRAFT_803065 [Abortiporus biennis]
MFISVSLRVVGIFVLACALTSSAIPIARTTTRDVNRFRRELNERSSLLNEDFLLQTRAIHEGCYEHKPRLSRRASSSGDGRRTPPDGYIPFLIPSPSGSQRSSQSNLHAQPQPPHHQIAPLRYQLAPSLPEHPQPAQPQHPQPAQPQPLRSGRRPQPVNTVPQSRRKGAIYSSPSSSNNQGGSGPSSSSSVRGGATSRAGVPGVPVRPPRSSFEIPNHVLDALDDSIPPARPSQSSFTVPNHVGIDERGRPIPANLADVRPERRFAAGTSRSRPASPDHHKPSNNHGKNKRSFGEGLDSGDFN